MWDVVTVWQIFQYIPTVSGTEDGMKYAHVNQLHTTANYPTASWIEIDIASLPIWSGCIQTTPQLTFGIIAGEWDKISCPQCINTTSIDHTNNDNLVVMRVWSSVV